jgi:putative ABC transport system permease protein
MASIINQVSAVTAMNLRSIPQRLGTSLVIVVGIAGVVGVMTALLAMAEGFSQTLASTGAPDRAIVLRAGSNDELGSVIGMTQAEVLRSLTEAGGRRLVRAGPDGQPLVVPEIYLLTDVARRGDTTPNNVVVRGTLPSVLALRAGTRIIEGRMFTPGLREVVVGRGAAAQFEGLRVGSSVLIRDGVWPIVGIFDSGGDVHESELWVDEAVLRDASRRQSYTTVTVQLVDADAFGAYRDALTTDPRLTLQAQREPDYYASRSQALNAFITGLGYSVAVIMAIGAVFGALNTMYAAISTRTVEIATLRAIGFGGAPVVASVLAEALVLSLLGAVLGGAIAYGVFNGYTVSTLNFQTFSQVAFAFRVTPELLVQGMVWSLVIGFWGGLFPALRAARVPVVDALRAA